MLEGLTPAQLNEPGHYSWLPPDAPLGYFVAGNTFGHYQEHVESLAEASG